MVTYHANQSNHKHQQDAHNVRISMYEPTCSYEMTMCHVLHVLAVGPSALNSQVGFKQQPYFMYFGYRPPSQSVLTFHGHNEYSQILSGHIL